MIKVIQARTDTVLTMKCACVNLVLTTAYGGGGAIIIIPTLQMIASCVGPGKSNLPFELRRKAGDCSRVTAGPTDLI